MIIFTDKKVVKQINNNIVQMEVEIFSDETGILHIIYLITLRKFIGKLLNLKIFVVIFTDTMIGLQTQ